MEAKAINTDTYLNNERIKEYLDNVDYIIMAAPAPSQFKETPIHFSIFLNTDETFSEDIKKAILDKFMDENDMTHPVKVMSQIMPVGFSMGTQETPMPLLLIKPEDQSSIPYALMHVIDFLADSDSHTYMEVKTHQLIGWSYVYN